MVRTKMVGAWLADDRVALVHELANPTSVLAIQAVLLRSMSRHDPRLSALADGMHEQVHQLRGVLQRLDEKTAGVASVEPLPMAHIARDVCSSHTQWAGLRGVRVARPNGPPARIEGDVLAIKMVLANLLSNAIKAAAPDDTVVIGWTRARGGMTVWLRCLPAREQAQEPVLLTRSIHGRGVGLRVVKRLLRDLGGELTVRKDQRGRYTAQVFLPNGLVSWP